MRKLKKSEYDLLNHLILISNLKIEENLLDELFVENLNDGQMGSLLLIGKNNIQKERFFGGRVSEFIFKDTDGIQVIASLNIDNQGELYELDIWKTNFQKLVKFPEIFPLI